MGARMNDYVEIVLRRNRGWPWPEDCWGLSPMFGEDGWCRACGVPRRSQSGSIVLQRNGLTVSGGWVPNWQFDVYCLVLPLADEAAERFGVDLHRVMSPNGGELEARQIVIESSPVAWFDPADLTRLITSIHGEASKTCPECGVTRWMPVSMDILPKPAMAVFEDAPSVVASPEWFGDGWRSYRQILWRRDVADFLLAASPRDFTLDELAPLGPASNATPTRAGER